jgi:DNA ligase-1
MKQVFDVIEQLRATSSTKEKLAILVANKDNADLKEFLRLTYEPRVNYYIAKVDPTLQAGIFGGFVECDMEHDDMTNVYNALALRDKRGNEARSWLSGVYNNFTSDWSKELLALMIQRDVKAGISKGTINKAWPGLVTDMPYMRCNLLSTVDVSTWDWIGGVYSQIKADGMFSNVSHHIGGKVTIESRSGSPMPLDHFGELVAAVRDLVPEGYQCHGELLMRKNGKVMSRAEGNGLFNKLLQEGELPAGHVPTYDVWDMIPLCEAKPKNKFHEKYKVRFERLKALLAGITEDCPIQVIEHKMVHSLQEAYAHAAEAMGRGLEGTVICNADGIWEDSDGATHKIKLKLQFDIDLRVTGFKAADTKSKNKDLFGSLMCESECGKFRVNVSGIKDDKRKDLFNRKDDILGKLIVTITCNGLQAPTANTEGYWSCFLPRFQEERLDKTSADTLEKMQEVEADAIKRGAIYGAKKKK